MFGVSTGGRRAVGNNQEQRHTRPAIGRRRYASTAIIALSLGGLFPLEAGAMGERVGDARSSLGGLCQAGPLTTGSDAVCLPDGAYRRSTLKQLISNVSIKLSGFNTQAAAEDGSAIGSSLTQLPWKVPLQPDLGASKNMVLANSPDYFKPLLKVMMYSAFYQAQPEASYLWRMNIHDEADYQNAYQLGLADPIRKQQVNDIRLTRFGMRFVWKY